LPVKQARAILPILGEGGGDGGHRGKADVQPIAHDGGYFRQQLAHLALVLAHASGVSVGQRDPLAVHTQLTVVHEYAGRLAGTAIERDVVRVHPHVVVRGEAALCVVEMQVVRLHLRADDHAGGQREQRECLAHEPTPWPWPAPDARPMLSRCAPRPAAAWASGHALPSVTSDQGPGR
jgi:hypothetical protein